MKIIRQIFRPLPQLLFMEPVFGCNYSCFFCIHGHEFRPKRVQIGPALFDRLKPLVDSVSHIHLSGLGEPFLNEHLGTFMRYFQSHDKSYYINTNGSRISSEHIEVMLNSRCELSISLDAGDKPTYEKIRHPGKWDGVMRVIRNIARRKAAQGSCFPLLYLSFNINGLNLDSLKNLPEICRDLAVAAVKFSWTRLPASHCRYMLTTHREQTMQLIRQVAMQLERIGVRAQLDSLVRPYVRGCWDLTRSAFVGANGHLAACCNRWLGIGDLNQNEFADIWNSTAHRRIFFGIVNDDPIDACKTCRQIRRVDYFRNPDDYITSPALGKDLYNEKSRQLGRLPSLAGLDRQFDAGFNSLVTENYAEGIRIYSELDRQYPDYYEIKNNLGAAYYFSGRFEKSLEMFKCIEKVPHNHLISGFNLKLLQQAAGTAS
jgi:wyosine [tRNA(Phe)-imidazoG37] synthetase (radical SAM superfamily)